MTALPSRSSKQYIDLRLLGMETLSLFHISQDPKHALRSLQSYHRHPARLPLLHLHHMHRVPGSLRRRTPSTKHCERLTARFLVVAIRSSASTARTRCATTACLLSHTTRNTTTNIRSNISPTTPTFASSLQRPHLLLQPRFHLCPSRITASKYLAHLVIPAGRQVSVPRVSRAR